MCWKRCGIFQRRVRLSCAMAGPCACRAARRSEEHTSELQSLMRISYAVFCLKKKKTIPQNHKIKTVTTRVTRNKTDPIPQVTKQTTIYVSTKYVLIQVYTIPREINSYTNYCTIH